MMIKIRILDDEEPRRKKFIDQLQEVGLPKEEYDIGLINPNDVQESFKVMQDRQNQFRDIGYWQADIKMPLDDVDILIVDNELREFFSEIGIFTDADQVAYMTRVFSTCGLIIIMNRLSLNPFDLTLNQSFQRQFESFADLEIGESQLSSKALWGVASEKFHPWYWAVLPKWYDDFRIRIDDVKKALQENLSILDFFGITEFKEWIPKHILEPLGKRGDYTFLEFINENPFLFTPKDNKVLNDKTTLDEQTITNISHLVAARLSKWLEWKLLPEMDILVDAPHLALRFPSLLDGDHEKINTWNAIAVRHTTTVPNLKTDVLQKHSFSRPHWLSRPAWYWRKVMNEEVIPDVSEPWNIEYIPFVFCEDTSSFMQEKETKPFRAEVVSVFSKRNIEHLKDVNYLPLQRLAL